MAFEQFAAYADLPLRIMVGIVMLYHGYPKLLTAKGFRGHIQTVKSIGFRHAAFWAFCSAFAEFAGGLGTLLGGFTRIAAVLVAINMLVAWYAKKFKWNSPFNIIHGGYEYDLVLVAAALTLALGGAGMYSLDAIYNLPFA
jgi:putative oxidoreductase